MKYILIIFISLCLFACSNSQKQPPKSLASSKMLILNKEQFNKKIQSIPNVQLIDVRTAAEVAQGAIPNAINIDFYADNFSQELNTKLNKEKPVLVYCKSGGRSGKTAKILMKEGYKEIYDLKGGYSNWSK